MNEHNKRLLSRIQASIPLDRRPFKLLADELYTSEIDVINQIQYLKEEEKIIYTISGIFDGKKLGYVSALVAMKVDSEKINTISEKINMIPTVSHNYQRNDDYNLWFTLAAPSKLELDSTINILSSEKYVYDCLILPSLRTFKLNTNFNLTRENGITITEHPECKHEDLKYELSELDYRIIRQLQKELPIVAAPFDLLASEIDINPEELVFYAKNYLKTGIMRRYCASIRHYKAGVIHNAMVVWEICEDEIEQKGMEAASQPFVSHCYERTKYKQWPYNFYTMVHALTKSELNANIKLLKDTLNPLSYRVLNSLKELKKSRVKYFVETETFNN